MTGGPPETVPLASREALVKAGKRLLERVRELEQEKVDLEVMLETSAEHADHLSEELQEQRDDLATMLEMTTEHADTVEDELHEQAATALRKSAEQLRIIVEATPAPVLISRLADGEIVYANVMMGALVGASAEELLGRGAIELYDEPVDRDSIIDRLQEEKSVDREEIRFKKLDGTPMWVELSMRLLDFNDEPSILSALHDITGRKRDEVRLQQQVDALRQELEETSESSQLARTTGTTRFDNLDASVIKAGAARIIAVHSFRGGNGKSSITANLAGLLAAGGQRVAVVDADIQSPGMHVLLGRSGKSIEHTVNDFLLDKCSVEELVIDVTVEVGQPVSGQLFLIPASVNPGSMAQVMSQGYDAQRLTQCFHQLADHLQLDVVLVDTHPGLNEEALLTLRAVQTLILVLRPDKQDFEGTGVSVQVARQLEVPQIMLMVNQLPDIRQLQAIRTQVQQTFDSEVAAILPHAAEFMSFDGDGLFVLRHPTHPISVGLEHMTTRLIRAVA